MIELTDSFIPKPLSLEIAPFQKTINSSHVIRGGALGIQYPEGHLYDSKIKPHAPGSIWENNNWPISCQLNLAKHSANAANWKEALGANSISAGKLFGGQDFQLRN
jgi:hypothetical protein